MRFGSVCSGIEAASVAWHPLGWQAAWLAEIEPFPSAVLKHHYPEVPNLGDMTALPQRIRAGEVEAPDLFCGGTPCQAFSVAGLRQSLSDERGNLSLIFVEIANAIDSARSVRRQAPSIIFWENVPGVLSTKDNAFGCFLGALAGCDTALVPRGRWTDAGVVAGPQRTVSWRVLDAQYFGLAQRRRRVFVVASAREGFDPAAVLFEWEGVRRDTAPSREAGKVAPTIPARSTAGGGLGTDFDCDGGVIQAFGGGQNCTQTDVSTALSAHPGGSSLDFQTETFVAHTLRGEGFDASEDGTGRGTPLVPVGIPQTYAKTHKPASTTDAEGWSPVEASPTITHWFRDRSDTGTDVAVVQSIGVTLHGTDGTQSVASFTDLSSSLRARIPSGVENSTTTAVLQPVHRDVAQPYTLAIRGRGDTHQLEYRQDGTANALLTPNGGRGGIGVGAIAHTLRGEGFDASEDGMGRGTSLVPVAMRESGQGYWMQDDIAGTLRAEGEGRPSRPSHVIGFNARQDPDHWHGRTGPLDTDGGTQAVAFFQGEQHGRMDGGTPQSPNDLPSGAVRNMRRCQCGGASQERGLEGSPTREPATTVQELPHEGTPIGREVSAVREAAQGAGLLRHALPTPQEARRPGIQTDAACLHCGGLRFTEPLNGLLREARTAGEAGHAGNDSAHQARSGFAPMAVRRLTPVECERLQGFPDGYTAIPWRNKPASECPDGPRYKALGNSWAVPVVRWIGARIQRNLT